MTRVRVLAPAKINLTLHVTGQRADGYHTLDSLVAFAPVGDVLHITEGNVLSLTIEGPEASGVPSDMSNLAMKAAALVDPDARAALTLVKNLPVASGIGGGSSDAAAAFRGMLAWQGDARLKTYADNNWARLGPAAERLLGLGADVPMCLMPRPLRAQGIGEKVSFVSFPAFHAVLVNPRVPVATPGVFRALEQHSNPGMPDKAVRFENEPEVLEWISSQRNDLEAPAVKVQPVIGDVLAALRETEGCRLARMSGSGATCFGLYPDQGLAERAANRLRAAQPAWWVNATWIGDCAALAQPVTSEPD
ncbi:MAG: 4-(cytidine 5'-diphospho)-2-C-methyl-D-erythritol kinase [Pseudomonadota bacterium]